MRHGDSLGGIPDSDRRLSDAGIEQVISSSNVHIGVIGGIDAVYSSPYRRAQQTASLMIGGSRVQKWS